MLILRLSLICLIDKSLLKSLVNNNNVNNVYLMTSLIYVTLLVVAIYITSVFRSHCLTGATESTEKLNELALM